ncbi:MAG: antibiotic biosynthesis monooxygenase [Syntrophomonas sp.]
MLNRSAVDSGRFLFYEMYKDKAALECHSSTPYFQALLKNIDGLVAEEPQINFYEDLTSINR